MPGVFSDDSIQRVRDANDIVNVVESYLPLKRAGSAFKALCPFHQEKTPSFTVNPSLQLYKCFGCGAGGDVFRFVMQMDGLSFPEAVETLAERAGVPIERSRDYDPARAQEASEEKNGLRWLLKQALRRFESFLADPAEGREALAYLTGRGFTPETIRAWRLGWAPDRPDSLLPWLVEQAGGEIKRERVREGAVRAGLLRARDDGTAYDFFRGRVLFPIMDLHGHPIAFGGRILREDPARPVGKYVNSPETPLFSKSRVLFGLDAASREMRLARAAVVVEGYTDAIMCHQHGIRHVVATLGTALTRDHVRLLRRYADSVIALFDSDEAGRRATDRALRLFLEEDLPLRVVRSLEVKDACEFLPKRGAEAFRAELDRAEDAFTYLLRTSFEGRNLRNIDEKAAAVRTVMEAVHLSPDRVKREMMRQAVARYADVPVESLPDRAPAPRPSSPARPLRAVEREARPAAPAGASSPPETAEGPAAEPDAAPFREEQVIEFALLRYMLAKREWCDAICAVKPPEEFSTATLRHLAAELHDAWSEAADALDIRRLLDRLHPHPEASAVLSDLTMGPQPELAAEGLGETLDRERLRALTAERALLYRELVQAQTEGDAARVDDLYRQGCLLDREIRDLRMHASRADESAA